MKFLQDAINDFNNFRINISRAFRFVWRASSRWTLVSISLQVILGVTPVLSLWLLKLIIDEVTSIVGRSGSEGFSQVLFYVGLIGLLTFVNAVVAGVATLVSQVQGSVVSDYMHKIIHAKAIEIDLEYYENPKYNDKLHRMQNEAPFLPMQILQALLRAGQSSISLTLVGGWLFFLHWAIVPILLVAAIPKVLVQLRFGHKSHSLYRNHTSCQREASYLHELLTIESAAKEVRLYSIGNLFAKRFQAIRKKIRSEELVLYRKWINAGMVAETLPVFSVFGLFSFIAYRTASGMLTIGDLAVYFQAIQKGLTSLQLLMQSSTVLYRRNLFINDVHEFLSVEPRVVDPEKPRTIPKPIQKGIVFDKVSFGYPGTDRRILDNISLHISPGEHIALVGENGAGKSSLVKLLCRLYDPTEGRVTLDGIDIKDFSVLELRNEVSGMFQDYVRFHLPAKENIWLGNISLPPDSVRVQEAVEQAGAQSILEKLTRGPDTILGRRFEGGEELSIGEWQKIALARAFFRDSPILILDEPTSAMDARAEVDLFQRFHSLAKGRTAILISHRLSSVQMVKQIYFLEEGKVVEHGSHDELLERKGCYAALFEMQAEKYR